jgi:cell division protein FtsQ
VSGVALRVAVRRTRLRTLAAAVIAAVALLGGGWLWLRDSSLVAIRSVSVIGVSGRDAAQIRAALVATARRMTTLDLQVARLRRAVSAYPDVVGLRVFTQLPHGVRIVVVQRIPVAALQAHGQTIVVDSDGVLLPGANPRGLPIVPLRALPGAGRVRAGYGLAEVQLLAAAPWQLLGRIAQVTNRPGEGLVAALRHGPAVYFGTAADAAEKWDALIAVLASGQAAGAGYINVSDPVHPAAGTGSPGPIIGSGSGAHASGGASGARAASTTSAATTSAATTSAATTPAATTSAATTPAATTPAATTPAATTPAATTAVGAPASTAAAPAATTPAKTTSTSPTG